MRRNYDVFVIRTKRCSAIDHGRWESNRCSIEKQLATRYATRNIVVTSGKTTNIEFRFEIELKPEYVAEFGAGGGRNTFR